MTEQPWDSEDAAYWRSFLDSERGKRWLERIVFFRPPLLPPNISSELTAQHAQLAAGYETCVGEVLRLRKPDDAKEKAPVEAYPPLEDESQWQTNPKTSP